MAFRRAMRSHLAGGRTETMECIERALVDRLIAAVINGVPVVDGLRQEAAYANHNLQRVTTSSPPVACHRAA